MPAWVNDGFQEYAKRMPAECSLHLHEVSAGKRGKNADIKKILEQEGELMCAIIPDRAHIVCLSVEGRAYSTAQLSKRLEAWMHTGQDIALLVGGPEGLAPRCAALAQEHWSLSALTLPHPLVRVVIAESLYRAWSLLRNHPYHRAD